MKIQVRRGCFETNSSSTHSLQLVNGDLQTALNVVNDLILKAYAPKDKDERDPFYFDPEEYFEKDDNDNISVIVKGIDFADGDECFNAYSIVTNWMAKIQYLGEILYAYNSLEATNRKYWNDFEIKWGKHSWNDNYGVNPEYMKDLDSFPDFMDSDTVKWFKEWVKSYIKEKQHIDIVDVIYDPEEYRIYLEGSKEDEAKFKEIINDKEKLFDYLNSCMDNKNIMLYKDEAYSPYDKPTIKIY